MPTNPQVETTPKHVTLAELNANASTFDRDGSSIRYVIGKAGSTRRGQTGMFGHIVTVHTFSANGREHAMYTAKCSERAKVGSILTGTDTDSVGCSKCLAWLERATSNLRKQ